MQNQRHRPILYKICDRQFITWSVCLYSYCSNVIQKLI